jgi:hypothetical protein
MFLSNSICIPYVSGNTASRPTELARWMTLPVSFSHNVAGHNQIVTPRKSDTTPTALAISVRRNSAVKQHSTRPEIPSTGKQRKICLFLANGLRTASRHCWFYSNLVDDDLAIRTRRAVRYSTWQMYVLPCAWASVFGGLEDACWPLVPKFADSNPAEAVRIFQGEKIPSAPSFGGEVNPAVPCRRFTACKRSLNVTWKSAFRQNSRLLFIAH